jgi:hypothetical protein
MWSVVSTPLEGKILRKWNSEGGSSGVIVDLDYCTVFDVSVSHGCADQACLFTNI